MLSPQNCRPKASHVLAYVTLCDNMGSTLPRPYLAHCRMAFLRNNHPDSLTLTVYLHVYRCVCKYIL